MINSTPIVLASSSPRRQELLRQIGIKFETIACAVDEKLDRGMPPAEIATTLADRKCQAVAALRPDALVIGADTVVCLNDQLWSKPENPDHAKKILKALSGQTHQVITGVSIRWLDRQIGEIFDVKTEVTFGNLSDHFIEWYIRTGEPLDKAGAYGIQGLGALLVKSIRGSYSNVMGLPLFEVGLVLKKYLGDGIFFMEAPADL